MVQLDTHRVAAFALAGIGSVLMVIPVLDISLDLATQGSATGTVVLQNSVPLLLSSALVALGYMVLRLGSRDVFAMVKWCAGGGIGAFVVGLWTVGAHVDPAGTSTVFVLGYFVIWGAVLGTVVGFYDSWRSTNEAHLRGERNQFQAFFENVPSPAVGVRFEGNAAIVQHVNSSFEEVFGFAADDICGEPLAEFIVPPEQRDESTALVREVKNGTLIEREVKRRTADSFRTFMFKGIPVETATQNVNAYAIYADITKEKEQKQRLQVLYRVLRHDLRNRMNVVKGNAEIILEELDDPGLEEWDEALTASADELINLSSQTRQIERSLDAGDYSRRTVDASVLVETIVEDLTNRYPSVDAEVEAPQELSVVANDLIDTAVQNAVENAFEHNSGPEQSVCVTVQQVNQNFAEIIVRDDGPGIPESERRLFANQNEVTQLQHASGLGLWLLNWIVEQSGGEIKITDNEPTGTEVRIRLPQAACDPAGVSGPVGTVNS